MVTRHTADIVTSHLEKQHELLVDAYSSKSDELHKLQVEEEMLMCKFFDLMIAQGLMKTKDGNYTKVPDHGKNGKVNASVTICKNEKL
ncbi:hypothetical protein Vadar_016639 [Vaccinium darrowii]|uniref:Uncharacterized protein n=1 Tax=Vaccinium darrowii TaxID=229202 RepID=A0ACB7XAC7_9ERIC|nr:hypothetical protein Vadar_016639 [Vaccinium darrowii]